MYLALIKCVILNNAVTITSTINDYSRNVDFTYLRRHSGVLENERADALAKVLHAYHFRKILGNIRIIILKNIRILCYWGFYILEAINDWNSEFLSSKKGMWTKCFLPRLY